MEDFYTAEEKNRARSSLTKGLTCGVGLIMAGAVRERARRAKRERSVYAAVRGAATVAGLALLFTPANRMFLLAWAVGGIVCAIIKAVRTARSGR